jgi:hypothetical protein
VINELFTLSEATLRDESEESTPEGERTRTVTITGSPSNAQMGQLLVTQKLQLVSASPFPSLYLMVG